MDSSARYAQPQGKEVPITIEELQKRSKNYAEVNNFIDAADISLLRDALEFLKDDSDTQKVNAYWGKLNVLVEALRDTQISGHWDSVKRVFNNQPVTRPYVQWLSRFFNSGEFLKNEFQGRVPVRMMFEELTTLMNFNAQNIAKTEAWVGVVGLGAVFGLGLADKSAFIETAGRFLGKPREELDELKSLAAAQLTPCADLLIENIDPEIILDQFHNYLKLEERHHDTISKYINLIYNHPRTGPGGDMCNHAIGMLSDVKKQIDSRGKSQLSEGIDNILQGYQKTK